jgi:hypothetical protein
MRDWILAAIAIGIVCIAILLVVKISNDNEHRRGQESQQRIDRLFGR